MASNKNSIEADSSGYAKSQQKLGASFSVMRNSKKTPTANLLDLKKKQNPMLNNFSTVGKVVLKQLDLKKLTPGKSRQSSVEAKKRLPYGID